MLSSHNSGKYLSGEWQRERERCARDKELYSTTDQTFYEVSAPLGQGDRDEDRMKVDTCPIDQYTIGTAKPFDIRELPEVGD